MYLKLVDNSLYLALSLRLVVIDWDSEFMDMIVLHPLWI
jgi:hypothetical protein